MRELLPEAVWQRCDVHFLRNALDYLPRKADDDCRQELRWLYDRRNLKEAQQDLQAWLARWATRYPKLTDWVEAHIGETLNFYSLPRQHHKHLKSTNMLERLNEEIKRRTRVVRIFPNPASRLRLVRALCAEVHEGWPRGPPLLEYGVLERTEEGTTDRRLTDHGIGLSHENLLAQLDVHNLIAPPTGSVKESLPDPDRSPYRSLTEHSASSSISHPVDPVRGRGPGGRGERRSESPKARKTRTCAFFGRFLRPVRRVLHPHPALAAALLRSVPSRRCTSA